MKSRDINSMKSAIRRIFAENYTGSGDVDEHTVMDGTEQSNQATESPRNNGGVQYDDQYYPATMPQPLNRHDSAESMAGMDKPDMHRSDMYSDFPFGEQSVDENHANGMPWRGASLEWEGDQDFGAGGGANYFKNTPNSDKMLDDGYDMSNLVEANPPEVQKNFPQWRPVSDADRALLDSHVTERDPRNIADYPDINSGRRACFNRGLNPMARSAREIRAEWGDSGSNVEDIMYPREEEYLKWKHEKDFGTGDTNNADTRTMSDSPFGDPNHANVVANNMADAALQNYLEKIGLNKKAYDDTPVTPDAQTRSGPDRDDNSDVGELVHQQPPFMTDGKMPPDPDMSDKSNDPMLDRRRTRYENNTQTEPNPFQFSGPGGDGQNYSGDNRDS